MLDLTHQEAAAVWLCAAESDITAFEVICKRNNLGPEMITRIAENYVRGMNKLRDFMKEGADTRVLLTVIEGGKQDDRLDDMPVG